MSKLTYPQERRETYAIEKPSKEPLFIISQPFMLSNEVFVLIAGISADRKTVIVHVGYQGQRFTMDELIALQNPLFRITRIGDDGFLSLAFDFSSSSADRIVITAVMNKSCIYNSPDFSLDDVYFAATGKELKPTVIDLRCYMTVVELLYAYHGYNDHYSKSIKPWEQYVTEHFETTYNNKEQTNEI